MIVKMDVRKKKKKAPVQLRAVWKVLFVTLGGFALVLVPFFYKPTAPVITTVDDPPTNAPLVKDECYYPKSALSISTNQEWFLVSEEVIPVEITSTIPPGWTQEITVDGIVKTETSFPIAQEYGVGTHEIRLSIAREGCKTATTATTVNVSYPLYIAWTHDWEGYDVKQEYLDQMDELTYKHYNLPQTHYFNPRIYATSTISKSRAQYLTDWVINRRDSYGHQIALHFHMFTDMTQAAGVEPQEEPRWGWTTEDGYDILVMGYEHEYILKILNWGKEIFEINGLGTPDMFRAGGWFADEGTLIALEDAQFIADSSGRTSYNLGRGNVKGPWYLSTTQQPYYPNIYNQNSSEAPNLSIMEIPNNGGDSWAFSAEKMISRFDANFGTGILAEPAAVTYLSHPHWFYEDYSKIDELLTYIDTYLYQEDSGPVVYVTQQEIYNVWKDR